MKWWDQMPWSSFSECWARAMLFPSFFSRFILFFRFCPRFIDGQILALIHKSLHILPHFLQIKVSITCILNSKPRLKTLPIPPSSPILGVLNIVGIWFHYSSFSIIICTLGTFSSSDLLVVVVQLSCCCSAKSCPTLCNCSTPESSVLHYLPDFAQIHLHWFGEPI